MILVFLVIIFGFLGKITSIINFDKSFCDIPAPLSTLDVKRCEYYSYLNELFGVSPFIIFVILTLIFFLLFLVDVKKPTDKIKSEIMEAEPLKDKKQMEQKTTKQ